MSDRALSGLKVVDLTHYIAGPYCTKLLASFGAEVIKVERLGCGDPARAMGPFLKDEPHPDRSGFFLYLNTGKKSITLNLKTETGVKIFKDLVKDADVLVENFHPRVMPSVALSYETLEATNPRLVMTSISNFGQTGPYRDYKANTLTILAVGGQVAITGEENRPYKMGGWQAEYMAGIQGFQATLIALLWRGKDGPGQHVDLSIMDVISGNLEGATTEYPYVGMIRRRKANRFTYGHPVGGYECKDGYVMVIPGLGGMPLLALLLERPELEQDSFFMDRYARQERWQEFDERYMHPYFREHTKRDVYERAQELRMPFALISTIDELPDDPQLKHRQYFVDIDHPVAGKLTYPGAPFKMSETAWQAERAPLLGEHNEEIYGQRLGYGREELVELRERHII
jgi:crotonobetainyl-CoA:carnitine CoA-transferase CaiB-like acyl-CoA transferase